jgi:hypothetical protein
VPSVPWPPGERDSWRFEINLEGPWTQGWEGMPNRVSKSEPGACRVGLAQRNPGPKLAELKLSLSGRGGSCLVASLVFEGWL